MPSIARRWTRAGAPPRRCCHWPRWGGAAPLHPATALRHPRLPQHYQSCSSQTTMGPRVRTFEPAAAASEAHMNRHTRQRAARATSSRSGCGSCRSAPEPLPPTRDDDESLCDVICRLYTLAETGARHRRQENAVALKIGLDESEQVARQKEAVAEKATRLAREQVCTAYRMAGVISSSWRAALLMTTLSLPPTSTLRAPVAPKTPRGSAR